MVVSATRVARPMLEIPAAVDRIYADEIREGRALVNLSESLGAVPGIFVQNRQNYAQDLQISSRGFGARATFGVRGIRLIVDGIPATMPDGQGQAATIALGSAQSIEVMRGPFSSMYGNASGGVINVVTEDGPPQPMLDAGYWAGSYGSARATLKFGGQEGSLNYLLDGSRFSTDGYRQHSAATRDQLNSKFKYTLSDDSTLTLVVNSLRQLQTQDPGGLTRTLMDQDPRQVVATQLTMNARKTVIQDQAGMTFNHRLEGGGQIQATLYSGARWVEQYLNIPLASQAPATHSGAVVNLDRGYSGAHFRFSQEADLLGRPFTISLGAEHESLDERRKGFINNLGVSGALKRDEDDTVTTTGLYAQGEWKFAERWSAHAGLRTSRVHFNSQDFFLGNGNDSGARDYSATTPVGGIVFRATPLTSFYANAGRGFETPTFAELANRNNASGFNFALDASSSRHAELGVKTIIPGRARLNAALFDIVTKNEIVVDQNAAGRATFKNVGHTDRNGLELSAETLTGGPFEARAAYTYLNAAYREAFNTVIITGGPPVPVAAGSLIPGVARNVLYAELRYRKEPFFAQLEGTRKSRVAVNDPNLEFADGYTTINLAGGLVQRGAGWRFTEFLRVDNLTDRNYVGSVIVNEGNGRYYEPSPRRNALLGLQASLQF